MSTPPNSKSKVGLFAAIGAALAASACCVLPLALIGLGVSGAWIGTFTALEPYRPIFIGIALAALAYAGYQEYRTTMAPDCECEIGMRDWIRRGLLVVGALAVLGLIASPWIIRPAPSAEATVVEDVETAQPEELQEVVLEVDDMTCASCKYTVEGALERVDGVTEAEVTFVPPEARVRYDASRVTTEDLIQATTEMGYPSRVKPKS